MLFRKERNDLFNLIVNHNLLPNDFSESNTQEVYRLKYIDTDFYLDVKTSNNFHLIYSFPSTDIDARKYYNWGDAKYYVEQWISFLEEETSTPDLWKEAQANSNLFALNEIVPDEMFNAVELRQLEGQVRLLSQQIAALGLPANAQKLLTTIVEEIPKKATRLTKEEVRGWFMSAIVTQVTTLALSPEHLAAIGHLLKTTFMGILQLH